MRDYHVLVAGSEQQSARLVRCLRERGLNAWSDRISTVLDSSTSLLWADVIVVLDTTADLAYSTSPRLKDIDRPKVLLSAAASGVHERIRMIESYDFDFVLGWPTSVDVVGAFVERAAHRAALPLSRRVDA